MKVIRHTDRDFPERLRELTAPSSLFDVEIEQRTRAILDAVQARGDAALLEYTARFDGAGLAADQLPVAQAELVTASLKADESLRAAVTEAEINLAAFAKKSKRRDWRSKNSHGAIVGERFDPFQRVGVYIPGGPAPLVGFTLPTPSVTVSRAFPRYDRRGWRVERSPPRVGSCVTRPSPISSAPTRPQGQG